jgi:hypothetical protein
MIRPHAADESGMTLIEVVLSMLLFAIIMAPLTTMTFDSLHDLFRSREVSQRTDSYTRSAYLFTTGLSYAQLPLRQAEANQLEYRVRLDDGDRYVFVWKSCTPGAGIQPGIYAAISAPRRNLVVNPSFEDGAETAYGALGMRPTSTGLSSAQNGSQYLQFGQTNQGYPDDADPASAPPGTASQGTSAQNTGQGTNPATPTSGQRRQWPLGSATPSFTFANGSPYNQDFTIGAPAGWTRHYREDENRGQAVAPTEWPQAERVTFAQADDPVNASDPIVRQAPTSITGGLRAGSRALRLTTWGSRDPRRQAGSYFIGAQPTRPSYAYLQSRVFSASPGTRFLVGGYMADLVEGTGDAKTRPRIEWFWMRSENGREQVIPERSGAVTMPDTDDDTPDGGLNAPSTDFGTFRYKVTRPAPEGTVGIQLRLTVGQFTANDSALFDGIMLQPMSGPRIDTQRVNDYSADRTSRSPHTYFDGSTPPVTGSDVVANVYAGTPGLTSSAQWDRSETDAGAGEPATPQLDPSSWGSRSFVTSLGQVANPASFQSRAQLLFSFDDGDFKAGGMCAAGAPSLFEYANGAGSALTAGTAAARTQTRQVQVNLPVFRNPQTADDLRFPVGSLLAGGDQS